MNAIPYLMSARNLVTNDCEIIVTFHGDKTYSGRLSGLKEWANENNPGVMRNPGCVSNGFKHGLFPCIIATTARLSGALSVDYGRKVAVGDGRSFFTHAQMIATVIAIRTAGVVVPEEAVVWAISDVPYGPAVESPQSKQPELPLGHTSIAQQHAEAPF